MIEFVPVPVSLLVEISHAVSDAALLPGCNQKHRKDVGRCAEILLRVFGQTEGQLVFSFDREDMKDFWDNLYNTTRDIDQGCHSPEFSVDRSQLKELVAELRQTAVVLAKDEPEVTEPHGWVDSERLRQDANLLAQVIDDPAALGPDWFPFRWACGSRHWFAPTPDEIDVHEILTLDKAKAILTSPLAEFYVYFLIDKQDEVFYVGKGTGLRLFEHEREVYSQWLGPHTNWKKLNKIASLLQSGVCVRYYFDSWHQTGVEAFDRENELITLYEYLNARRLCNWGGHAKPSKLLIRLRTDRGLQT